MPPALDLALRLLLTAGIASSAWVMLSAGGAVDPAVPKAEPLARALPLALLLVALVATWWRGSRLTLASAALVAALLLEGSPQVRLLVQWLAAAAALALGLAHAVLPVVALRRFRLPERYALAPLDPARVLAEAQPPTLALAETLAPLGFAPLTAFRYAAGASTVRMVVAVHPADPAIATLTEADEHGARQRLVEFTQLLDGGRLLAVAAGGPPEALPREPASQVVRRAGTPAEAYALLASLRAGLPLAPPPRDAEAMARRIEDYGNRLLAHWTAAGLVARGAAGGTRRLTPKGAVVAAWKQLWPGRWIVARRNRSALAALLARAGAQG